MNIRIDKMYYEHWLILDSEKEIGSMRRQHKDKQGERGIFHRMVFVNDIHVGYGSCEWQVLETINKWYDKSISDLVDLEYDLEILKEDLEKVESEYSKNLISKQIQSMGWDVKILKNQIEKVKEKIK